MGSSTLSKASASTGGRVQANPALTPGTPGVSWEGANVVVALPGNRQGRLSSVCPRHHILSILLYIMLRRVIEGTGKHLCMPDKSGCSFHLNLAVLVAPALRILIGPGLLLPTHHRKRRVPAPVGSSAKDSAYAVSDPTAR